MTKINVEIGKRSWHSKIKNPEKYFITRIKKISKIINFFNQKNIVFTIFLTDSLNLKKLNKKFRNKNKTTDVLSFPNYKKKNLKSINKKKIYIGDIAVSYEIINKRSLENTFVKEFDKVWIHGLLHLIGYDHIKNQDYLKMLKVEKKIYKLLYSK